MHPSWLEMVRRARGRQHRVELTTNGPLLDAGDARALVALGKAQVTVSVDFERWAPERQITTPGVVMENRCLRSCRNLSS